MSISLLKSPIKIEFDNSELNEKFRTVVYSLDTESAF